MRTNRLLEMIYLLLNKRQQTAEELASHFNVSVKTIYRDVDTLSEAGIPISKQQGIHGGIVLSKDYAMNKSKLTVTEEAALMRALDEIKKLPNAQLDYALKLMKQYFNEAATLWVNSDDISLAMQEKFHQVKRVTIEKRVIEFQYFAEGEFLKYRAEPYELRIKGDVWKLLIRRIRENVFEEVYLSRMVEIDVKAKIFFRREIPEEFCKKYCGNVKEVSFVVHELTDELLNRFPIEDFEFAGEEVYLRIKIKPSEEGRELQNQYAGLEFIVEERN